MIRNPRDCPFCAGQGFVCTGLSPSDVDACKACVMAARVDYERIVQAPIGQTAIIFQFPERRVA